MGKSGKNQLLAKRRQGFTLLEIAIVFMVAGGVIAAVFSAASVARYRVNVNQASDELNLIASNIRNFYAGQSLPGAVCKPQFLAPLQSTYVQSGVFPPEMVMGGIANNPWNSGAAASTVLVDLSKCGKGVLQFVIRYTQIAPEVCADLTVRNSMPGSETGLTQIIIGGAGNTKYTTAAGQLPVTPIDAATACVVGLNHTIDWYYDLNN